MACGPYGARFRSCRTLRSLARLTLSMGSASIRRAGWQGWQDSGNYFSLCPLAWRTASLGPSTPLSLFSRTEREGILRPLLPPLSLPAGQRA